MHSESYCYGWSLYRLTLEQELLLIAGMVIATYTVRFSILYMAGRVVLPRPVNRALRYVPVAVLTAITSPMLVKPDGEWLWSFSNPYLVAGVVAMVTSAVTRNLLLTISIGMGCFFLLRF